MLRASDQAEPGVRRCTCAIHAFVQCVGLAAAGASAIATEVHDDRGGLAMTRRTDTTIALLAVVVLAAMILAACGTDTPPANGGDEAPGTVDAPEEGPGEDQVTQEESAATTEGEAVDGPASRPDWLSAQMPLPAGASYSFSLPAATGGESAFYYVPRPVAEVIEELETLLPSEGWTIVDEQTGIAWQDDRLFTVEGHGERLSVYAEPMAGAETETNVIYGPAQ